MSLSQNKSIVLIQSRLNSSRLPGKAMLTIEGVPMVALAALRAANTGKDVKVLTSSDEGDDEICKALEKYGISYFRGSLENVLSRFYDATIKLPENKIIFRLTADNVLPDGYLLDQLEQQFLEQNVDIMSCTPNQSNLPYGISAEIFSVKALREAFKNANTEYDKEHVTPYIYRNSNYGYFHSIKLSGFKNYRVTIDTFDDYISVKSLFKDVEDIVNEPIVSLLQNLSRMKYRPISGSPIKPMTLGTVQFGMDYGVSNRAGMPEKQHSIEIIKQAITEGIEYLDTAPTYGESERIIGEALNSGWSNRIHIITKLPPYENDLYSNESLWALAVRCSILKSCINLKSSHINTVMLHRAKNILVQPIIEELLKIKMEGIIDAIGVSVQTPSELNDALERDYISLIQLPFNILDYRWDSLIPKIAHAKKIRGLTIHSRSSLLQGLLCSNQRDDWLKAGISNSETIIDWLESTRKKYGHTSISDLCINYVNSQSWIDSVVIGIDSMFNLHSNLQSISKSFLSKSDIECIKRSKPILNENSLNPASWSRNV